MLTCVETAKKIKKRTNLNKRGTGMINLGEEDLNESQMINLTNFVSCASYQLLVWLKPPQISPMRYKNTKTRSINPKQMRMRKDGEDRHRF